MNDAGHIGMDAIEIFHRADFARHMPSSLPAVSVTSQLPSAAVAPGRLAPFEISIGIARRTVVVATNARASRNNSPIQATNATICTGSPTSMLKPDARLSLHQKIHCQ